MDTREGAKSPENTTLCCVRLGKMGGSRQREWMRQTVVAIFKKEEL